MNPDAIRAAVRIAARFWLWRQTPEQRAALLELLDGAAHALRDGDVGYAGDLLAEILEPALRQGFAGVRLEDKP